MLFSIINHYIPKVLDFIKYALGLDLNTIFNTSIKWKKLKIVFFYIKIQNLICIKRKIINNF